MQDLSLVRNTYEKMTDEQLVHFTTYDAKGLTPDAREVLKEEIRKRNLDTGLVQNIEAYSRSFTEEEITAFCDLIRCLPCPVTGRSEKPLNATMTMEVKSFVFVTQYKKKIMIASPDALKQANTLATSSSLAFGLWGIPWGVIRTIEAVIVNTRNQKKAQKETPTEYLRSFVNENAALIEIYKDDREKLTQLLRVN